MTDEYGKTFKLDSDGDLSITSQRVDMVEMSDKVAQDLRVLLQTIIGENILHRFMGMIDIEDMPATESLMKHAALNALAQYHYTIYVSNIECSINGTTRIATISIIVTLTSGVKLEVQI